MRRTKTVISVMLILIFVSLIGASSFVDDTEAEFNQGTYNNTFYNATGGYVQLNNTNANGTYVSKIYDAGANSSWYNISWAYVNKMMDGDYAHYSMNETTGTNVSDSSGYERHGTMVGMGDINRIRSKTGLGNALIFNQSGNVNLGNIAGFERTQPFSFEYWYNATVSPSIQIIASRMDAGSPFRGWEVYANGGKPYFELNNQIPTTYIQVYYNTALNDGQYHHLVWTYTGGSNASNVSLYVDGSKKSLTITADTLNATAVSGTSAYIGYSAYNARTFNGTLDEFVIYNRTLTQAEVTQRYNLGNGSQTPISLGGNSTRLDISARSCDDALCFGDSWVSVDDTSPQLLNLNNRSYFQYNFSFLNYQSGDSPMLYNVTTDYEILGNIYEPPNVNQNYNPTNPANYVKGQKYNFSASISDWLTSVVNVTIEHNFTGVKINVTPKNNTPSLFWYEYDDLAVGTYNITWYANDTQGNQRNDTELYIINKAAPTLNLTINSYEVDKTLSNGSTSNVTGIGYASEGEFELLRNGSLVDTGQLAQEIATLDVGIYNYTYRFNETQNYTGSSVSRTLFIGLTPQLSLKLNGFSNDLTVLEGNEVIVSYDVLIGSGYADLYRNGALISSGVSGNVSQSLSSGSYNYVLVTPQNESYVLGNVTRVLKVTGTGVYSGLTLLGIVFGLCFLAGLFLFMTWLIEGGLEAGFLLMSFFMIDAMVRVLATISEVVGLPTSITDILEAIFFGMMMLTSFVIFWIFFKFIVWIMEWLKNKGKDTKNPIEDDIR